MKQCMKSLTDQSGQSLVLVALSVAVLLGFVALATDVGTLFHAKRNMQIAADSAAIAGAAALKYGNMTPAAIAAAAQNGVTIGVKGGAVAVSDGPQTGAYAHLDGYVEAVVSQNQPTFFTRIFHIASQAISARAVASNGPSNGCIDTLGSSGPGIQVTGNADISVPGCGVIVNSNSNCPLEMKGNANLTAQSIGLVGPEKGRCDTGNISITPTPVTGIVPISDPLAYLPAPTVPPGCTTKINLTANSTQTISYGCYAGISASGNTSLTLNPGVYIINGDLSLIGNTSVTGANVTLVLLGGSDFGGNISLKLSAPTDPGLYQGVLIDQPATNTKSFSLTGNAGSTLKGVIYAPGAAVTFNGNSGTNIYTSFVVNSLTLTGNSGFNDYATIAAGASPLTSVRLVE